MEKYDIIKRLGVGSHGAVYLVKQPTTKKFYALKKIEVDERKKTRTKEAVLKEASILSQLRHPHIILFHESFLDPSGDYVCIILDYCDGGNLSERLQDASQNCLTFSEKQIMQWFIQIVMAVQYIHSKHILHRDLKAENVFLNKRNVVKLGDFGISKILDNTIDVAKTVVGTPYYLSPELCQDIPYNSKSDIWAVGCLLYEMCALHPPFDGQSLIGLFFNIVKAEYKPLPEETPNGVKDLISHILVKTPEDRPSCSAILNQPYIKQHLAAFIADTENIRALKSKRDSCIMSGGRDNCYLLSSSGIVLGSREPITSNRRSQAKPKPSHNKQFCCFSPQCTTGEGTDLQGNVVPPLTEPVQDIVEREEDTEYSDDFDDSSSSEIEEDLLPDGDGGCDKSDEVLYADDFEEYISDEEIEDVVKGAREAQVIDPIDDFFVENEDGLSLSQTLTQSQIFQSHVFKSQVTTDSDC